MRNLILSLVLVLALVLPVLADTNQNDINILYIPLGSTNAATEASGTAVVTLPQAITVKSAYVICRSAVASDSSDYLTVEFLVDGSNNGTFTSSATALVADTPAALTPTDTTLAKDSEITARLNKVGSGQITTNMVLQINYFNGQ